MTTISNNENSLLSLLQLSDSFFPLGGYTLSFGLESFSQLDALTKEKPKNKQEISSLLSVFIEQLSTSDCPALRSVYKAAKKGDLKLIISVDRKLSSLKNVKEVFEASKRTGRALLRTVEAFVPRSKLLREFSALSDSRSVSGTYPVCLGLVCHELGVDEEKSVFLMIYTMMVSILGAAIRLGHITHLESQEILHSSERIIQEAVERSSALYWRNMRVFSPILDIMGMKHVYLATKMFAC